MLFLLATCLHAITSRAELGRFADAEELNSYGDSVVFGDEWFGEFSPNNALHTVTRGRWAYLPVMKVPFGYFFFDRSIFLTLFCWNATYRRKRCRRHLAVPDPGA